MNGSRRTLIRDLFTLAPALQELQYFSLRRTMVAFASVLTIDGRMRVPSGTAIQFLHYMILNFAFKKLNIIYNWLYEAHIT